MGVIDTNEIRTRLDRAGVMRADVLALCDEIDRLRAKPKPQGKTVRVKVAVAVDPTGNWNASGWRDGDDIEKMGTAFDPLEPGEARYWLTAELPIPEKVEVVAEVHTATTDENATSGGRG